MHYNDSQNIKLQNNVWGKINPKVDNCKGQILTCAMSKLSA